MDANCKQAELWISIRVDGERLGADEARRLDEHLEACAPCRGVLEAEARRAELVGAVLGDREAEARLSSSVLHALRREGARSAGGARGAWRLGSGGRWTLAAAALLVISFAVWQSVVLPPATERSAPPDTSMQLDWEQRWLEIGPDGLPRIRKDHWIHEFELPPAGETPRAIVPVETRKQTLEYLQFSDWKYH